MSPAKATLMSTPLNVLIIEDSEEDADLIVLELKRGGFNPQFRRVDSAEGMRRSLGEQSWDLMLSDFSMPHFTAAEALAIARQHGGDAPFVIVSATIGEEAAVEAMKAGAHDYVLKHRLGRLVPAVQRELRESKMRRERRQLEEQLRRAQKLESLGLLAGGVAHDFNNLLTGILGNASLALDMTAETLPIRGMLEDIVQASERAADLTRQLLAYAGKGNFIIEPVSLPELVREIADLIRASVPRTVTLDLDLRADIPFVEGDATQIQQLVMNLILNAAEATGEKQGTVRISADLHTLTPEDDVADYRPEPPPAGKYVKLQVSDNGCGMSAAVRAQIFDPFFTTKFTGRGLGLAAALGIVYSHRGAILVESEENAGSTFTVLLPALPGVHPPPERPQPERLPAQAAAGTVLIIDDEEVVRSAARAALQRFGYAVYESSNGVDGVELFTRLHDRISAVLLDLTMPQLDGAGVWRRIRQLRPDMRVVISSGYEEEDVMRPFAEDRALLFLKKPFTAAELGAKIGRALKQ